MTSPSLRAEVSTPLHSPSLREFDAFRRRPRDHTLSPDHESETRCVGTKTRKLGFTLVELLVVMAIIAMFVSAMLPAVLAMRSSARRAQCQHRLLQLMMAVQSYESSQEHYPAGVTDPSPGPIISRPEGFHHGWIIPLLPYMDQEHVYRRLNLEEGVYSSANESVRAHAIPELVCPAAAPERVVAQSSYAACHAGQETPINDDNDGVFFLNSAIARDDVLDGLAQTIFLGEKTIDEDGLGWMSGTRATLRNTGSPLNSERSLVADASEDATGAAVENGSQETAEELDLYVGGFGSSHAGGANMVFGDGRLQFMTDQIDPKVYQQLGDRDDGALLSAEDYRE